MTTRHPPVLHSHLLTLAATCAIATSFPVGAAITESLDPLVVTLIRFAIAALLFAPFIAWRYGMQLPSPRDLARYSVLSAALVGFFWAMFTALRYTTPVSTAAIFALTPGITAMFAFVLLGDRLSKPARIALPVGMAGAVWIVFRGDPNSLLDTALNIGDLIFFAGTVAMGLYSPLVKYLRRSEPIPVMTFWTLVTGTIWLAVFSAPILPDIVWTEAPPGVYGGIVYLAVVTTLFTFFVFQWSATVIGPTKVMSYTYLNPVVVILIQAVAAAALPAPAIYPGIVLAIAATLMLQLSGAVPADFHLANPADT